MELHGAPKMGRLSLHFADVVVRERLGALRPLHAEHRGAAFIAQHVPADGIDQAELAKEVIVECRCGLNKPEVDANFPGASRAKAGTAISMAPK